MADLVIGGAWQALDGNGDPIPGALAYFYDTGTTTPRTTYQDVSGSTPHDDPVEADANGFFPEIFVTGGTAVKCVLKTAAGVTVTTQDPCARINTAAAAAAISFTPTAEIAQTNVQDAIEQVQTNYETDLAVEVAALDAAKQPLDALLTALAGQTTAEAKVQGYSGADAVTLHDYPDDNDLANTPEGIARRKNVKAYVDTQIAASGGSLKFIETIDLSNDATADFVLPSGYDSFVFELMNVVPSFDPSNLLVRTSTDGGSTFDSVASDYAYAMTGYSADATNSVSGDTANGSIQLNSSAIGGATGEDGLTGTVRVAGAHLAMKTIVSWTVGYIDGNPSKVITHNSGSGVRLSSADVDAIQFLFNTGNLESGTITLWGMRNA